jgi:ribonuclease P protein component
MVAKQARISRTDFPAILQSGKRFHSTHASAVVVPAPTPRVSVVVSKKVAKQAVDRNRLRRRVYGVAERFIAESPLPYAVIFLLRPGALRVARQALAEEVAGLLAQIMKSR